MNSQQVRNSTTPKTLAFKSQKVPALRPPCDSVPIPKAAQETKQAAQQQQTEPKKTPATVPKLPTMAPTTSTGDRSGDPDGTMHQTISMEGPVEVEQTDTPKIPDEPSEAPASALPTHIQKLVLVSPGITPPPKRKNKAAADAQLEELIAGATAKLAAKNAVASPHPLPKDSTGNSGPLLKPLSFLRNPSVFLGRPNAADNVLAIAPPPALVDGISYHFHFLF